MFKRLFGRKARRGFMTNFNQVGQDKWNPKLTPPDAIVRKQHESLIAKCRDIADNDSYGAGIITTFHENVVTSKGIQIQNISDDKPLRDAVDRAWREFVTTESSTRAGIDNFIEVQRQIITSFLSDGEVFLRKHVTPNGLKVELIDPARVPYALLTKVKNGQMYRNGILVKESTGEVVGYRVDDVGRETYKLGATFNENHGTLVPADEMIHVAMRKRSNTIRGIPLLATVVGRIFKISQYENAVLDNATSSARKYGFLRWTKDAEVPPDIDLQFKPSESESGSFHELPQGVEVDTYSSPFPDDELAGFTRAILLACARAIGISYPTLSGDLLQVNYASIRQAVLAERAVWTALQEFIVLKIMLPVYKAKFMDDLANGRVKTTTGRTLSLSDMPEVSRVVSAAVQFAEIDPRNENQVETARMQNMVVSPSEIIRQRGGDPEQTWAQVAKDIQAMLDAGIPSTFVNDLFLRQPFAVLSLEEAGLLPTTSEVTNAE